MNVLRRGFAAAALRSMPHSRPAMLTPPSPRSQPVPALFLSNIRAFNSRMLSTAPGTGDNAQSSSKTSSSSEGDSGSANDDDAVKKVGPRRWKWLGALAVITGATVALAYEDLEKGQWEAGDLPSLLVNGWKDLFNGIDSFFRRTYKDLTMPPSDKLLPDQAAPMPVLVIGLEGCLSHTEWTREHGHRHMKRPGTEPFLTYLSTMYEIVLWSSALQSYTDTVRMKIDPKNSLFAGALFHEDMRFQKTGTFTGKHIKDLQFINRPLGRVVSVDTNRESVSAQPSNAILIKPWSGDPNDTELIDLIPFLEALAVNEIQDVRPIIRHVNAHSHGVAAAYDELLKNVPGGSARSKLSLRGGSSGGVFAQFVVNEAQQPAPREETPPPPAEKPKPKRLITKIEKF